MYPKNIPERRKAFINFLIFLLISVAIIVTTVFMSTQMPFKQGRQLQAQVDEADRDRAFSQRFSSQMFVVTSALDSLDKITTPEAMDPQITGSIAKLTQMIETDSVQNKGLYSQIALMLASLHTAKIEKRLAIRTGTSSNQQSNSSISSLTLEKQSALNDNDQIQKLVDRWETRLDPAFVQSVRTYKSKP